MFSPPLATQSHVGLVAPEGNTDLPNDMRRKTPCRPPLMMSTQWIWKRQHAQTKQSLGSGTSRLGLIYPSRSIEDLFTKPDHIDHDLDASAHLRISRGGTGAQVKTSPWPPESQPTQQLEAIEQPTSMPALFRQKRTTTRCPFMILPQSSIGNLSTTSR
jgi:hypothetical protein